MKFFKIEISNKTDILAFAAFLLALGSVVYQTIGFFRGPDINLFPPEQILINSENYPGSGIYARFSAPISYVNKGQVGHNGVIRREKLIFYLGAKRYEQVWQTFESFDLKDGELIKQYKSDAHPVPVNAGSSISHETYFAPRAIRCPADNPECDKWKYYLEWSVFINELEKIQQLEFIFHSETFENEKLEEKCTIDIDKALIERLNIDKWAAPSCW